MEVRFCILILNLFFEKDSKTRAYIDEDMYQQLMVFIFYQRGLVPKVR